jgi:hypothetical protein
MRLRSQCSLTARAEKSPAKWEHAMPLATFGILATVLAGCVAYDQYDKKTNYQLVNARISDVTEQCYMEKVEHGVLSKSTSTSDMVRCEVAELLTRTHPKWQGYSIKHSIEVRFTYVSPVDGATHASSMRMSAVPNGKPLHMGDMLQVRASKTKVDQTRSV